eukprot:1156993-Pelagomonas_calceolata.AAC.2
MHKKLHKAVVSGKYTFVFPQEAQKVRGQHRSEKGPRGHDQCVMFCFALQFSASTVIDAMQCFKKGNRRYSLVSAHHDVKEGINCVASLESLQQISTLCSLSKTWHEVWTALEDPHTLPHTSC